MDQVLALDEENRAAVSEANELRANRNALSKQVGMLMGQAKKDPSKLEEAEAVKAQSRPTPTGWLSWSPKRLNWRSRSVTSCYRSPISLIPPSPSA